MLTTTHSAVGSVPVARARFWLPRELHEEAGSMATEAFLSAYAPSSGPLRLGHWQCTDVDRPASRLGPQARHYRATIAVGDRITTTTAAASGPIAALTSMLYDLGVKVEMLTFHQRPADGGTATFIHGSDGSCATWALGLAEDATQSALRAMIACANRLHADRE